MLGKQPEQLVWLALTIFGVWRLTAFLAYEQGPFDMAVRLRRGMVKIGLGRMVGCFYCLSLWMSFLVLLVFRIAPDTPVIILGVAGAVALVERIASPSREGEQDDGA